MQPPPNEDPRLDHLLGKWQPAVAAAPAFDAEVWARIHAGEQPLARILRFPLTLPLAACLALALGAAGAYRQQHQRTNERMALAYAQSINPFQKTSSHHHHGN